MVCFHITRFRLYLSETT